MEYGDKFIIDGVRAVYWSGCGIRQVIIGDRYHFRVGEEKRHEREDINEIEEIILKPTQFEHMLKKNRIKRL